MPSDWVDIRDRVQQTFNETCRRGHWEAVKGLLAAFPELDIHYDNGGAIQYAYESGNLPFIREFVEWFSPNLMQAVGAFRCACYYGHIEVAEWHLGAFPDININQHLTDALGFACMNWQLDTAKWLVGKNARVTDDVLRDACDAKWFSGMCWLLTFYSAEQFWSEPVQSICKERLQIWRKCAEYHRQEFMTEIAPELSRHSDMFVHMSPLPPSPPTPPFR